MRIQCLAVSDRLAHDPPDELEVHQVVGVDVGHRIGLKRGSVRGSNKQRIVLVENIPRQNGIPALY